MSFEGVSDFDQTPPEETKQWMQMVATHGFEDEQHIVPVEDTWTHQIAQSCTCHPSLEPIWVDTKTTVLVTHNAWDCREFHDVTSELPGRQRME